MTDYRATVTPADVEFVAYDQLQVGDVLVHFTRPGKHLVTPPTERQLRLRTTTYDVVVTIEDDVTSPPPHLNTEPKPIKIVNRGDASESHAVPFAHVWRLKSS